MAFDALRELRRGLARSSGFALFVVVCNKPRDRDALIQSLCESLPGDRPQIVRFDASCTDPFEEVVSQTKPGSSAPLLLINLELSVPSSELSGPSHPVLASLNLRRAEWPERVPRPVVLWVPDYLLSLLGRYAPDFLDWRSDTIYVPSLDDGEMRVLDRELWLDRHGAGLTPAQRRERVDELRARLAVNRDSDDSATVSACADWLAELGEQLQAIGRAGEARDAYAAARDAWRRLTETPDPSGNSATRQLAYRLARLAEALIELGDRAGGKASLERALAIAEEAHGPDDPAVAIYLNNLGRVLHDMGALAGAKACIERALEIGEKACPPEHPIIALCANNLGHVLKDSGDLAGARACLERALLIDENAYGAEHPEIAIDVNNLGTVLHELGDSAGARACLERALVIDEKAYGAEHTNIATVVNNLGSVLQDLGDMAGAKACLERALAIDEKAYGTDHPHVAIRSNNLGALLQKLGDLPGAKACFKRALVIDENACGADHTNVAIRINNLGSVLQDMGDLARAKAYYERAHGIFRISLGEDHPKAKLARRNLAGVEKAIAAQEKKPESAG